MNRRRSFLKIASAGILNVAFSASGQLTPFRVAWVSPSTGDNGLLFVDAFRQGLRDLGYAEGRNIILDVLWGGESAERLESLVADLVKAKPHVIVAQGPTAYTVRRYTKIIPVVFGFSGDPVAAGFVQGYARPGGNLTGISFLALELVGKRIEMLKAVMPGLQRIAVVANSQHPGDQAERRASEAAAAVMGLTIEYFETGSGARLNSVLATIEKSGSEAVVMFPIQSIINNGRQIAAWSVHSRIPVISGWAPFADRGNLMTYGCNLRESFRRLATYVDRILKGANPGDLPVEIPEQIEFVINLKTARALGIKVPQAVMLRADRLID